MGRDRRCICAQAPIHRRLQKKKHESAPHPPCPSAARQRLRPSSPSPRGEGKAGVVARMRGCNLENARACPFAPRSGEKVVRQHRMRGRGRWGAFAAAAVRECCFIGCCGRSTKAPLIRGCRRTFSPSPRGEGTADVFARMRRCNLEKTHAGPFAPRSGEKGLHAHSPECSRAFLRQRQPPFSPSQRGEGTGMLFHQSAACILATTPASLRPAPAGRRCGGSRG